VITCETVANLLYYQHAKDVTKYISTDHRRVVEKEFGAGILEALQVLVDLALFFQKHICGRL